MSNTTIKTMLNNLEQTLERLSPLAVAVSGGVDSMTLAFIANRVNPDTVIFHALSPAVPVSATQRVKCYAEKENWQLNLINANEMDDPDYVKNPTNRCYFCKSNLYTTIQNNTSLNIASGTNMDDLNDFRPGLQAARENNIYHPWVEAGINKINIRQLAKYFSLADLQELPAAPCLSSRITTGIAINADLLLLIDQVEDTIKNLLEGCKKLDAVRCRIRQDHVAIQLATESEIDCYVTSIRATVSNIFHNTTFEKYTNEISIEPYQKGSAFIRVSS